MLGQRRELLLRKKRHKLKCRVNCFTPTSRDQEILRKIIYKFTKVGTPLQSSVRLHLLVHQGCHLGLQCYHHRPHRSIRVSHRLYLYQRCIDCRPAAPRDNRQLGVSPRKKTILAYVKEEGLILL